MVCWFLHAIIGLITLFVDYSDKELNPDAYYFVLVMTFKWIISAVITFVVSFLIYLYCKLILKKEFGEYIGAIYLLFSVLSSVIIILAVPFGFRAIYLSSSLQFMTLLYIQIEIVLDVVVISEVCFNMFLASNSTGASFHGEEDQGFKDIMSNRNLERLQNEILAAYQKNDLLKFNSRGSREHTPERTHSDGSRKQAELEHNSILISELGGEKNMSSDFGSTLQGRRGKTLRESEHSKVPTRNFDSEVLSSQSASVKRQGSEQEAKKEKQGNEGGRHSTQLLRGMDRERIVEKEEHEEADFEARQVLF